ncbi:MAG: hypothetical protein H0T84_04280 [Tatlockia sp.]|nr:hypothetical protein [Tatlockia sp.]
MKRKFNLQENDFKLVVPQTRYNETNLQTFNRYLGITSKVTFFLWTACAVAAVIVFSIAPFPPGAILTLAAAVVLGLLIASVVFMILTSIIMMVGHGIDSSFECEEKYLEGSAFNTDLIMEAYTILYKETGNASNQDIELGEQDLNEVNSI